MLLYNNKFHTGVRPGAKAVKEGEMDIGERVVSAWNHGDVDGVVALYAEDAVYQHPMVPGGLHGRDAIREFVLGMTSAFSDIGEKVTSSISSGDEAAVEILHSAIQSGELQTPAGPVPATNKRVELNAAHFYRLNADGLIAEERMYANPMEMMAQLGVGPG